VSQCGHSNPGFGLHGILISFPVTDVFFHIKLADGRLLRLLDGPGSAAKVTGFQSFFFALQQL